jgi:thiol-disulfide isomerase/thioredoxin
MKHLTRLVFLILVIGLSACTTLSATPAPGATPEVSSGLNVGAPAPTFSTTLLDGKIQSLKGLQGKVVLINFWATWCGPCRTEMPYFQQLADTYKDQGFTVLAINNREAADVMQPFIDQLKLTFPIGLDKDGRINTLYMARQYPTTYVIGRDGTILARQFGPFPEGTVETLLKDWLQK